MKILYVRKWHFLTFDTLNFGRTENFIKYQSCALVQNAHIPNFIKKFQKSWKLSPKNQRIFAKNTASKSSKFLLFFGHNFHDFWIFFNEIWYMGVLDQCATLVFNKFSVRPKFNVSNFKKCHFFTYRIFIFTYLESVGSQDFKNV